ncbi:unnamed protein product [Taenia asiatica]|uniref:Transmembrane protein n=1 Tax=Taenia asiatica TaxID=60517 RepID=A0A0R3WAR0_TAEAS|nr:unnamed protein product [Taenia asiatica]
MGTCGVPQGENLVCQLADPQQLFILQNFLLTCVLVCCLPVCLGSVQQVETGRRFFRRSPKKTRTKTFHATTVFDARGRLNRSPSAATGDHVVFSMKKGESGLHNEVASCSNVSKKASLRKDGAFTIFKDSMQPNKLVVNAQAKLHRPVA